MYDAYLIEIDVLYSKSSIATQILLTRGASSILVDVGDGVLRDLTERHFRFETLDGILVTHEHSDHTGGLFSLIHFLKHLAHPNPLYVLTARPVNYLNNIFSKPLMYSDLPFEVKVNEVEEGDRLTIGEFQISPFRASHVDFDSIGYSISDSDGYRVVVSGDTRANEKLEDVVRGADVAILESTFEDGQEKFAESFGHMTVGQASKVGELAKKTILIHQMPQEYFSKMTCAVL